MIFRPYFRYAKYFFCYLLCLFKFSCVFCCCCYSRARLPLLLFPTSCIVEFRLCVAKKGNVRSCWYSVLAHTHTVHSTHLALGTYPLSVLYANCQWKYLLFPILYFNVIRSAFCPVLMLVLFILLVHSLARLLALIFFPGVCIPLISLSFPCALYFYIRDMRSVSW